MPGTGEPYVCMLSPELVKKAQEELNEKPEWRARDIQALRDMVKAHPGLHCRTDDAFMLRFLRARKFDYDRAYELLINYFMIRDEYKELFKDLRPSALGKVFDDSVCIVLPNRDKDGRHVMYLRPGKWDPTEYEIYRFVLMEVIGLEIMIQEEETQIRGVTLLSDLSGFGMVHAKSFERNYAKIVASIFQDAFPMRLTGILTIHEPSIFSYVFGIMKPFLKEKIKKRIKFYAEDVEGLNEEMGAENLPNELGGTLGPVCDMEKEWREKVLAAESYFQELATYYLDVPKQITKKTTDEAVESLVGTYKKLNVD